MKHKTSASSDRNSRNPTMDILRECRSVRDIFQAGPFRIKNRMCFDPTRKRMVTALLVLEIYRILCSTVRILNVIRWIPPEI